MERQQNQQRMFRRLRFVSFFCLIILSGVGCASVAGQPGAAMRIEHQPVEDGDVDQGRQLLYDYGCGACHTIPGVPGASTQVGPPLNNWSQRHYIAGSLPNTLNNLISWIVNPQGVEPGTAMPILGVNQEEARHMSAYLYSLGN